ERGRSVHVYAVEAAAQRRIIIGAVERAGIRISVETSAIEVRVDSVDEHRCHTRGGIDHIYSLRCSAPVTVETAVGKRHADYTYVAASPIGYETQRGDGSAHRPDMQRGAAREIDLI